jgi:hypothetical protein
MVGTSFLMGLLLLLGSPTDESPPDGELLQRAEAQFREGIQAGIQSSKTHELCAKAAGDYETLRRRGYSSANLYRNLGNAHFLAGNLPGAIRAYRRGLRLAPEDRALKANLEFARSQVAYSFPGTFGRQPRDSWPIWLRRPSIRPFGLMVFLFYSLIWPALARWQMVHQTWLLSSALGLLFLTLILGSVLVFEVNDYRRKESRPLVVISQDGVVVRKGNGTSYPAREEGVLNRGVEAYWLFTRGDWHQIEFAGGEVGWVHDSQVLMEKEPAGSPLGTS